MSSEAKVLNQNFTLGFTYTRSTGPIVGRFFGELKNCHIVGIKGSDGQVLVPPIEYDPVTAEALSEFVEVADTGVVKTWCWVNEPRKHHLMDKPFAWALIQLEGADTPLLHMLDAGSIENVTTGMTVRARWADNPRGHITDITCFEPV